MSAITGLGAGGGGETSGGKKRLAAQSEEVYKIDNGGKKTISP